MSASERLKALAERVANGPPGPPGKDDAELFAALPQIVAVVEATQRAAEYANTGYSNKAGAILRREAVPALAALEEALS